MFATVLQRMKEQDGKLDDILTNVRRTNGRVTTLERWRDDVRARVGAMATVVAGIVSALVWLLERLLT
jgi:hypothetical protein